MITALRYTHCTQRLLSSFGPAVESSIQSSTVTDVYRSPISEYIEEIFLSIRTSRAHTSIAADAG
ncbi:Hypothetical protein HEAR3007 [Herminiimonas arsenicoxydans]|uniref:Uncharacterized protein n=1 Tax=Herminiimonas arsenicoxydans TaxID=204773 RepID=A4G9D0_HERAR|nr:Hypothetical protein HEAR3007 [Herminiimonas arsenicoxydans]